MIEYEIQEWSNRRTGRPTPRTLADNSRWYMHGGRFIDRPNAAMDRYLEMVDKYGPWGRIFRIVYREIPEWTVWEQSK